MTPIPNPAFGSCYWNVVSVTDFHWTFLREFQSSSKSCSIEIKSKIDYSDTDTYRYRNSTLVLTPDTEIWFQLQTTTEQFFEEFQSQFPPKFLQYCSKEIKSKIYVTILLNYCQIKILLYFHEDALEKLFFPIFHRKRQEKLKKYSVTIIFLTFHCLNNLF